MIAVSLKKLMMLSDAELIIEWLAANPHIVYKFTGRGMSEITFQNDEDATLFKLMFDFV